MKVPIVVMAVVGLLLCSVPAMADPVNVYQWQDDIQDDWVLEGWVEELSTGPHDLDQLISSRMVYWNPGDGHIPCPSEYQGGGCVQVQITNLTSRDFCNVYYVGDSHDAGLLETTFTNWDERIGDVNGPFVNPGLAFKIDSVGVNTPLVFESMAYDDCFQAGETWQFVVQEYWNQFNLPASRLGSVGPAPLGAVAEASWFVLDPNNLSSASIVVPEPSSLVLIVAGLLGLALCRYRRRR